MNKQKLLKILQAIIPPFFIIIIKKLGIYSQLKKIFLSINKQELNPTWNVIKSGELTGTKIFIYPFGDWQKEMINGEYDKFIFDYLKKIDLTQKNIFDIGAHIGYHTLYFAKLAGAKGKIISFEPNVFNIERLKINLEKNYELSKNIQVIEKAISDKSGEEAFVFSKKVDKGSSSGSFLDNADTFWEKANYEKLYGFKRVKVQTTTIDEFVKKNDIIPDLIKLDIEGAEHLALAGAKKTLFEKKPILLIEIHSIFNMYKVCDILSDFQYKIEFLKEEKDGRCFIAAK